LPHIDGRGPHLLFDDAARTDAIDAEIAGGFHERVGAMAKSAVRRRPRGQGRPSVAGAVGEKAIVAAVRTALRTTPPGELTFNQVASLAGVDQRLIRYYFGTLPDLLRAAAVEVTNDIRSRIKAGNATAGSLRNRIRQRVMTFLEVFGSNPHFHRLVVEHLFNADGPERDVALDGLRDSISELESLLKEARGEVAQKTVDPRMAHIAMAALCEFFFSARPVFVALYGAEADSPAFLRRYGEFVTDLLISGPSKQ
jgi:AcrR family transcriptional regulator